MSCQKRKKDNVHLKKDAYCDGTQLVASNITNITTKKTEGIILDGGSSPDKECKISKNNRRVIYQHADAVDFKSDVHISMKLSRQTHSEKKTGTKFKLSPTVSKVISPKLSSSSITCGSKDVLLENAVISSNNRARRTSAAKASKVWQTLKKRDKLDEELYSSAMNKIESQTEKSPPIKLSMSSTPNKSLIADSKPSKSFQQPPIVIKREVDEDESIYLDKKIHEALSVNQPDNDFTHPILHPGQEILQRLFEFQREGLFCDATLISSDDKLFPAHSCIIAAASPCLKDALSSLLLAGQQSYVNIDIHSDIMHILLCLMYTGNVDSDNLTPEIHQVCQRIGIKLPVKVEVQGDNLIEGTVDAETPLQNIVIGVPLEDNYVYSKNESNQNDGAMEYTENVIQYEDGSCQSVYVSEGVCDGEIPDIIVRMDETSELNKEHRDLMKMEHFNLVSPDNLQGDSEQNSESISAVTAGVIVADNVKKGDIVNSNVAVTDNLKSEYDNSDNESVVPLGHLECEYCHKIFIDKYLFWRHTKWHGNKRPYRCEKCNRRYDTDELLQKHQSDMPDCEVTRIICRFCKKEFKDKLELKQHIREHDPSQPYECSICEQKYKQHRSLLSHMSVHTGQKAYKCQTCGEGFAWKGTYDNHIKSCKIGQKHQCKFCDQPFETRGEMTAHELCHIGDRPFLCIICQKSYKSKRQMRVHKKFYHLLEPQFQCENCGKKFKTSTALSLHMSVHLTQKKSVCEICGSAFKTIYRMRRHVRTVHFKSHLLKDPVCCELCGKKYYTNSQLKVHYRHTHLRIYPNKCNSCGKHFKRKHLLMEHNCPILQQVL